ncbi:TonB-dependent receptor plug domain-containing protein [Aquimarina sp. AD10]|uniref:TonB-dependent receptor n=1 Tax=Aquimarina sp. AD10 TaxID=1714849 RepID=UPI0013147BF0|nr:TonB-dependent receptor plug domain-containing protein [Aquimarina sp. AD10]
MIRITILDYIRSNNNSPKKNILGLFFVFFVLLSNGQTSKKNKILLTDVIADLENRFQYTFTFADDTVKDIFVPSFKKKSSFDKTLEFLKQETELTYTKLANNFISINKKDISYIICGKLKDKETGLALADATIQGKKSSGISKRNGDFEITAYSKGETIIIGHLGYKTVYRLSSSFKSDKCAEILLEPKTEELTEVVLSNYITKGIKKTTDGSFQIDFNDFGTLPGLIESDVLQTVQALPGIQSTDETVSNINIRGGTHDQNLILWDGIKMYQSGHFFGLISAFNPTLTRKATLYKNGTSAEYTDGVSGTIIMNTDKEINDKFEVSAGINMINADAFTDIPLGKKSSVQLAGRKSISDVAETPTYREYFKRISQDNELSAQEDIVFDFYDIGMRWNYNITDKDDLRVNFLVINNELVFTENIDATTAQESRQSSLMQNSYAGGIWYKRQWSDVFESVLQIYETDYELKAINANFGDGQRFVQENKVSETGAKLSTFYDLNKGMKWLNGYQFIETGVATSNDIGDPTFNRKENRVIRTHGLFSQLYYRPQTIAKTTKINLGIRYSFNEKFNSHIIEPRLNFNQQFLKYFNLEILGEFKHQNISQLIDEQNDFLGIEKRRWILSEENKEIPIIKSKQASLGLHYNRKGFLISIEGYYKTVDGITAKGQRFRNDFEFEDAVGEYTVNGVDVLVNKRFRKINTWASYSYAKNDYIFKDFQEDAFPNNLDARHSLSFGTSYILKDLKLSSGLNWSSGLPTTRPVQGNERFGNRINFEDVNSSRLDDYFRLDISATYDFRFGKKVFAHAGVSVWNITNNQNVINNYYRISENSLEEIQEESLGLTPNATFRVSF